MELLLLLLAVPVVWFLLLPVRVVGRVRRYPFISAGVIAALVVAGWAVSTGPRDRAEVAADYAQGDAALRAMIDPD